MPELTLDEVLRVLLDSLATPIVIVDPEKRIVYHNPAFGIFSGMRPREFREQPACIACRGDKPVCVVERCLATKQPISLGEMPIVLPNGTAGRVTVVGIPLFDAGGKPYAIIEQYVDVSTEERVQAKYRSTVELEREARRKAEGLAEELAKKLEELQQAHERLRELYAEIVTLQKSVTVGALSGGIAHELNNPLAVIDGHCEMMKDAIGDLAKRQAPEVPLLQEWVGVIQDCVNRCTKITSGLLSFMRGTKGNQAEPTPVGKVVDEALTLTRFSKIARTVDIQVDIPAELPPVPLIRDMTVQAVSNLLNNACQAMKGQGKIRVTAAKSADGTAVDVKITDNGPGIPAEVLQNLFKPFTSTKKPGEGTGLGLFLTRYIVERHGGRIETESAAGKGTTFTLHFPLAR